jgi:5-methylcytosine-specific restriction enzyme A
MKMLRPLTAPPRKQGPQRSRQGDERARLYQGRKWRKLRAYILSVEPLCRLCAARGYVTQATLVDHKAGHAGNWRERFYDPPNLQPLCADCHATKTQQEQAAKARGGLSDFDHEAAANHTPPTTRQHAHRKGNRP